MDKTKKNLSGTSHPAGAARKYSIFDKEALNRSSQFGKHRASSHDISGLEPEDDSVTDFTRNELLAFKASFARPKYANTYRMEPYRKCEAHVVRKRVEEILKEDGREAFNKTRDSSCGLPSILVKACLLGSLLKLTKEAMQFELGELKNKLQDFKYSTSNGCLICTSLTEDLLAAVKELNFDRYKYIVQVFLAEKTGQSIHIASRWVWDVARDNWVQGQYESENYVVVALIVACYYE